MWVLALVLGVGRAAWTLASVPGAAKGAWVLTLAPGATKLACSKALVVATEVCGLLLTTFVSW